ncbi:MAG: class I adenylate cyclase [Gammaproteobacteria bacterium]|nr:class I adenylate cyclase [Gammaproteobacteria bacterium]
MSTTVGRWTPPNPRQRDLESRFQMVTRERLRRVFDSLTPRQQDLLELLPLLFHMNHPLLPGYVSHDTPAGLADYTPSNEAVHAAKRIAKAFTFERHMLRSFAVLGVYLMGSPGTIAYTKHSDLDIWICHDASLPAEALEKLEHKARLIEQYAMKLGLEMHFFVFDAERFRRGETLSLSAESSGSSQHSLLLDEFYRSGLLIAGLPPLWWHVPIEEDARYEEYVAEGLQQRRFSPRNYVDFGGLSQIPPEEFFGAAVWQLYKSIESPYKSMMKLLLMETYASEYPKIALLSHRYKKALVQEGLTLNDLDPYISMYRKVEEYLMANNDPVRLALLRRAFYIKANEDLSQAVDPRQSKNWRRETLEQMTLSWGWTKADLLHLDRRGDWKLDTAIEERRALIKALQKSYAVLSDFARRHGKDKKITESDLNVLGRKLYAAFEKKPGKIEIVTRGICKDPAEAHLSLHQVDSDGREAWLVYADIVLPDEVAQRTPLKRAASVLELLAWCHFNCLAGPGTQWHLYTRDSRLNSFELNKILEAVNEAFPNGELDALPIETLGRAPRLHRALMFVNVGKDALHGRFNEGDVLTSNHTDAFQFGGRRINLVHSASLLFVTSWEEVFCLHHEGVRGLLEAVTEYLQWATPLGSTELPLLKVQCFSADYAQVISQRVERYVDAARRAFSTTSARGATHFIAEIEGAFHQLSAEGGRPHYRIHSSFLALVNALGEARATFARVSFDENCARLSALPTIYTLNKPGRIQIFAAVRKQKADVYIVDEHGALFVQRQDAVDPRAVFDHFRRFFASLTRGDRAGTAVAAEDVLEFYQMLPASGGQMRVKRVNVPPDDRLDYLPLRVFVDVDDADQPLFTIFCGEREFTGADDDGRLFVAIADHVLGMRAGRAPYPIYITDLTLSTRIEARLGVVAVNTMHLLNYKRRIEYQLTKALRRDLAPNKA